MVSESVWKKIGTEKSPGTGLRFFGTEMSLGTGRPRKILVPKKVSETVSFRFGVFSHTETYPTCPLTPFSIEAGTG